MKISDKDLAEMNEWLARDYGYFNGNLANWRIVWSDDEIEKRKVTHNVYGIELLFPEVVERPKYKQWIQQKYILERCFALPKGIETDMVGSYSYEPLYTFMDKDNNYLPPRYDVAKIIITSVMVRAAQAVGAIYKDPRAEKDFKEMEIARMDELKQYLWGNESSITDSLAAGEGVGYTKDKVI